MKKIKLRKWLQKPLRFHHQDLHDEIEGLTAMLVVINNRLIILERSLLDHQLDMARKFNDLTAQFSAARETFIEQKKEAIKKEINEGPPLHIKIKIMMELCQSDVISEIPSILNLIADEVEKRGKIEYDLDPGETADWLRAEATAARQEE